MRTAWASLVGHAPAAVGEVDLAFGDEPPEGDLAVVGLLIPPDGEEGDLYVGEPPSRVLLQLGGDGGQDAPHVGLVVLGHRAEITRVV